MTRPKKRDRRAEHRNNQQRSLFDQPEQNRAPVKASAPVSPPAKTVHVKPVPYKVVVPSDESAKRDPIIASFMAFHRANPAIYAHFLAEAKMSLKKQFADNTERHREGYDTIKVWLGAKEIFEKLRKSAGIVTKGGGFKLDNNFPALYARLAMHLVPELKGFFRLRQREIEKPD